MYDNTRGLSRGKSSDVSQQHDKSACILQVFPNSFTAAMCLLPVTLH